MKFSIKSLFKSLKLEQNPTSGASSNGDKSQAETPSLISIGVAPPNYAAFFKEHDGGLEWYTWMYNSRLDQHQCFQYWFNFVNQLEPIRSVLEFGCGFAVGYADFFKDIHYVGTDVSEKAIAWCKANRNNSHHDYLVCDFIKNRFEEKFDIVFSQGTIDNTYDLDGFLCAAVAASKRWIYITAYRGFFPHLTHHEYLLVEEQGCYYNNISPAQAYRTLQNCGARDIAIFPSYTGGRMDSTGGIPFETLIIARVDHA